jgi:hypothetical protein
MNEPWCQNTRSKGSRGNLRPDLAHSRSANRHAGPPHQRIERRVKESGRLEDLLGTGTGDQWCARTKKREQGIRTGGGRKQGRMNDLDLRAQTQAGAHWKVTARICSKQREQRHVRNLGGGLSDSALQREMERDCA